MSLEEERELDELLVQFKEVLADKNDDLGHTNRADREFITEDDQPIRKNHNDYPQPRNKF